jgi:hypothetical protein
VEIIIPNSVLAIEKYAFEGCRSLASVVLPSSLVSIGEGAFLRDWDYLPLVVNYGGVREQWEAIRIRYWNGLVQNYVDTTLGEAVGRLFRNNYSIDYSKITINYNE